MRLINEILSIGNVEITLFDDKRIKCSKEGSRDSSVTYKCDDAEIIIERNSSSNESGVLCIKAYSRAPFSPVDTVIIDLEIRGLEKFLGLTLHPGAVARTYPLGFSYYNALAVNRTPGVEKPPDEMGYPEDLSEISYSEFIKRYPCWSYPYFSNETRSSVAPYTVFLLIESERGYLTLAVFSNGEATAYLWPGPSIRILTGATRNRISESCVLSYAYSKDPYEATRRSIEEADRIGVVASRRRKSKPRFMRGLGWCSWNALLTEDLSSEKVLGIVNELIKRGLSIGYVIIDDGWQQETRRDGQRVLVSIDPDPRKFSTGFRDLVNNLKKLGVKYVGLWHTANIHWGGFGESVLRELGSDAQETGSGTYVPHWDLEKSLRLYTNFHRKIRSWGFDFVKIDNQWVIQTLGSGSGESIGRVARNIEYSMQLSAQINGLEILNCMSMSPENYSNFVLSNLMRVSIDYIPFWKLDAKLHNMFSIYNSLFYSEIAYPDYDMFMSYDPYALPHLVSRILSGGPVYITDRSPEKTNIDLLKRIILPSGEIVSVDEPGLPTRDILFANPYESNKLLKIAAPVKWSWAIGLININKESRVITDRVSQEVLPRNPDWDEYAYYAVFRGFRGVLRRGESIEISLGELETEIIILAPIQNKKAVIGFSEYLLPPYPVERLSENRFLARASGTLLLYNRGVFEEEKIRENEIIEI